MGKVIIVQINKQQLVALNKFLGERDVWMNRIYVDIRIKDYDIMQTWDSTIGKNLIEFIYIVIRHIIFSIVYNLKFQN